MTTRNGKSKRRAVKRQMHTTPQDWFERMETHLAKITTQAQTIEILYQPNMPWIIQSHAFEIHDRAMVINQYLHKLQQRLKRQAPHILTGRARR